MHYVLCFVVLLTGALAGNNFLQLPVSVERVESASSAKTTKNAKVGSLPSSMKSSIFEYFVEFELGVPGQSNKALLDTGSADVWVYGPQSRGAPYVYDAKNSTSSRYVNSDFTIHYADSSSSKGDYYEDVMSVGNTSLPLQFAVTDSEFDRFGKFGVGPIAVEADSHKYTNFPAALKRQGIIEVNAYSLFLDDLNATTGSLLFGAIDRSSFTGPLHVVNTTSPNSFFVNVEVEGHQFTAEPDSGTTYTYIPDDIVAAFASKVGATWNGGKYVTSSVPKNASLQFNFSGAIVTVNSDELFVPDNDGFELTVFPSSQTGGLNLLGDAFLRSAYIVYNADNGSLAIAQARYNGSSADIVPITANGIPGATIAPGF